MPIAQNLRLTEVSVNNEANTSDVSIVWESTQSGSDFSTESETARYYVSVDGGEETTYSVRYQLRLGTVVVVAATITVPHTDIGGGTVRVRTWMEGTGSKSASLTLTTIPRPTSLDSFSCSALGQKITYAYTPLSDKLYNRIVVSVNVDGTVTPVKTLDIGQKIAQKHTGTISFTSAESTGIYNRFYGKNSGIMRLTIYTYYDSAYSNRVGSVYNELLLDFPMNESTRPTGTFSITHHSTLQGEFASLYLQGKSSFAIIVSASGKYGATITSKTVSFDGIRISEKVRVYPAHSGTVRLEAIITDSRGFSTTIVENINIIPYNNPIIQNASAEKCDVNGNTTDEGTYLKIKAKRVYAPLIVDGTQKNFCEIRYRYRIGGSESYSSWVTILSKGTENDEIETEPLLGGLDTEHSYYVEIQAVDDLGNTSTATITIASGRVYMHRAGSIGALAFGKYAEEGDSFDIAEDKTLIIRGDVRFEKEKWYSLGLSDLVYERLDEYGRQGTGCFYMVCAGERHVYVSFNCACNDVHTGISVNLDSIPENFRPKRNVYAICATDGNDAKVSVTTNGEVRVHRPNSFNWIDGYIDYWI